MEIVYSAEGRDDVTVGAALPLSTADLQQHIASYAPFRYWTSKEVGLLVPEVGHAGSVTFTAPEPAQEIQTYNSTGVSSISNTGTSVSEVTTSTTL